MRDLRALPKAHLHLHLEATMRPQTTADLAAELGVPVPPAGQFHDFTQFIAEYQGLVALLRTPAAVDRLIDEAVEDAAADGAVAIELASTVQHHTGIYGSAEAALDAMLASVGAAAERHGIWAGLIVAIDRTAGPEHARETAALAVKHAGRGVTGLGLHSEERGFPASGFAAEFAAAKEAGLLAVPHAGELVGPISVRQALDYLKADRIQHGVRAFEDASLVAELADRGVCLDVCPTSNQLLRVVPSLGEHPLAALLAAGVRCSINADDPALFGAGLLDEYTVGREALGLDDEKLAACARTSVDASGAPDAVRRRAVAGIDSWLAHD
ncbi:adenosine deaminase [Cryptosporangium phraense]|uniref:Adenosine deaminase n=1 Tax=Cryptosporangium phraense TaxID=2593070 RepID=A0A545AXF5_9ACTN|nr:adenosine deaminase [Cryptosporangium phraense]TQS46017.1 adenosine deaminase [Cryptosporangium phraense]